MLKYAMEILLSESSVVTNHYFSWNTSAVAIFLAILGLTVLPVNALVGTYISNMFEDRFVDLSCLSTSMVYGLILFVLLGILTLVSDQLTICSLLLYTHLELCPFLYFRGILQLCLNKFVDVFARQLLMVSQITLLVGIIFSFKVTSTYSVVQYVVSALVTFVSAEVLEGKQNSIFLKNYVSPWH